MTLRIRLLLNISLCILAIVIFHTIYNSLEISLTNAAEFSGWLLCIATLSLFSYQLKKRFPSLPIGSASNWLQSHLYTGVFSCYVFFMHLQWQYPQGFFEQLLAISFVLTAITGFLGIILSRRLAYRLAQFEDEIIFETIPRRLTELREQVERIIVNATEEASSNTLAQFHVNRLSDYFAGPRYFWRHLTSTGKTAPLEALKDQERYMNDVERAYAKELKTVILLKEKADSHHALQLALKSWLLVHVPVAYVTILLLIPHVLLVYAFGAA